ncbi:MAG: XrtA/PEP-CTERM system TPR-repeat protein PrsT [Immundisolibacter sp.]|uniref:XrtA/PEP-CTERM system TPR-repeat protein PrsT n=1 Tax=Immundisolibacter sp. TaxID=1934948 RepID=UPI003EE22E53
MHSRKRDGWFPKAALVIGACVLVLGGCGRLGGSSAQDHLDRAVELRAKGDLKGSQIELKNALQKEPENPKARFMLGESHARNGDFKGAQKEFNQALVAGFSDATLPLARSYVITQSWEPLSDLPLASELPPAARAEVLALKSRAALAGGDRDGAKKLLEEGDALQSGLAPVSYGQALLALNNQEQEAGEEWLRKALDADPDYADALTLRADMAARQGRLENAEADYTRAIELRPAASGGELLKRGMVRLSLKKNDDARKDADALQKSIPDHPGVAYLDGLLKLSAGDHAGAQSAFELALSKAPDYQPVIFYLGAVHALLDHQEQAEYYLGRYLRGAPGSLPAARLAAGIKLRVDDVKGAIDILERAAAANPKDAGIHDLLGRLYAAQGDPKGIEMLKEAVSLQPDSAALRERLGIAMLLGGQQDDAAEQIEAAGRLDPNARQGKYMLVVGALRDKDFERALAEVEKLRAAYPQDATVFNLQGGVYLALNDTAKAEQAFNEALRLKPDSTAAVNNLGQLKAAAGDLEGAVAVYRKGLEQSPGEAAISPRLAGMLLAQNKPDEALEVLQASVQKNPANMSVRILLARTQQRSGRLEDALATLKDAGEVGAKSVEVQLVAGDMALVKKDFGLARTHFEAAATLDARSAAPLYLLGQLERQAGNPVAAEKRYRDALGRDFQHQAARTGLVSLLLSERNVSGAVSVLDDAARQGLKAGYLEALRGDIAAVQNNRQAALDAYGRALALDDSRTHRLVLAQAQAAYGDLPSAISTIDAWLVKNPQDVAARHVQVDWLIRAGRPDEALKAYETLLETNDKDVLALNNLAMLLRVKDAKKALDLARKARALAPKAPAVSDTLGLLLMDQGEFAEARQMFDAAVAAAPKASVLRFHLAQLQVKAGDRAAALATLDSLLESDQAFPERGEAEALRKTLK